MKKLCAVLILALVVAGGVCFAQQDRGASVVAAENLGSQVSIGKQYALFIAIDAYRTWPALRKPVADAREIRDILRRDYYIDEVIELYNQDATKERIIETFENLQGRLTVHDSLFIYYAGHGHLDNASKQGFWIPVDGGINLRSQENWLPNSQIRGYIAGLKTIHVFMVSDACFSGDILNESRAVPPTIDNAYYRRAYALTSRQVLTSGSSEKVPDQSEFSAAFKMCLQKNTAPLLDPFGIYNDVRLSVGQTTPLYGTLTNAQHQDGATFLFFRRPTTSPNTSRPTQTTTPVVAPPVVPVPTNFIRVEGGTFEMGSTNGRDNEKPVHSVTVRSFSIGKFPVTQKEWFEVMGTTIRQQRDMADKSWSLYGEGDNYPMYYVNWLEAIGYCNRRSIKEGLTPAYRGSGGNITCDWNANGYRLPTEAEWEYAAKGGNQNFLTYEYAGSNSVDAVAWYDGNSGRSTKPVGTKAPNALGIYDMCGNVWEWCWDWYGSYSSGTQNNPSGASSGSGRVFRGGSWSYSAQSVRSAYRDNCMPNYRYIDVGFRVVRPAL